MPADDPPDEPTAGRAYRQVSFVLLAAAALVIASLFAPAMAGHVGDGADPAGDVPSDPDGEPDDSFDWTELLEWLDLDWFDDPEPADPACTIWLDDDPVPGRELTATIHDRDGPIVDAPVWFNDHDVGQTDESGRVAGEIPYETELVVRVGTGEDGECRAIETTTGFDSSDLGFDDDAADLDSLATAIDSSDLGASASLGGVPSTDRFETVQSETPSGNATAEYEIDGALSIGIHGSAYPGEPVTIAADVQGTPVQSATVAVDGEPVGETDDDGTLEVTVPDDGSDRVAITVSRGEFERTATLDVLLLEARIVPDGLAPVPGSDGSVVAEIAGEPVEDATVAVDDDRRGTTDAEGRAAIDVPLDPTATVTVSTDDQTASTTLLGSYGGPVLAFVAFVAGAAAVGHRTHGGRGSLGVVAATGVAVVALILEAFSGPLVALFAVVVPLATALAYVAVRSDGRVRDAIPSPGDGHRLLERVVGGLLRFVDALESLLDRVRSLLGAAWIRLTSLPRSVTGLASALAARLESIARGSAVVALRWLGALRRLRGRTIAACCGGALLVAGSYVAVGHRVAAAVAVALLVAAAVARAFDREEPEPTASEAGVNDESPTDRAGEQPEEGAVVTLRDVWRSFAREVDPRRWRTRTPGEIERRALEQGYPPEPVRELTSLFRAVEYGDRPRSRTVRSSATAAAERIAAARPNDDGGENGSDSPDSSKGDDARPVADATISDRPTESQPEGIER
ncbi:DUF4129 domain-containing protein [Natrarchaeobius oligotrophus]|uniref:DUF4129 domain-containing protein n=1 Tax=Natrarchaeobius chitinivorans TaxID=1679083 RepID=A0A3N6PHD3_NATCH|nr:DUF4129 domain-containing protein [Natrarchaeobius chitinivorans]RQG97415.1 DUF4129 domain-containing protein [Natrarchaeobius chitinivorans]